MRKIFDEKTWLEKVDEYKSSGKSMLGWCKEKEINVSTFDYWVKKVDTTRCDNPKVKNESSSNRSNLKITSSEQDEVKFNDKQKEMRNSKSTQEQLKTNQQWVALTVSDIDSKEKGKNTLKINIGNASIDVENGFNKNLLLEVAKVLGELC